MSRFYTIVTPLKYDIVHVSAPLSYTSKQAINEAIQKSSLNHFFDIDLDALQNQLESFSWIAQVDIRRQWPAKLLLHIQEHRPIAQFNQTQWLNESGELFEAESEPNVAQLPHIMAPENQLLSVHRNLLAIQALCHKFNATLLTLTLDVRGAWQVKLDNGMQLFLGRKFILERLERFFQILPTLNVNSSQQPYIDLRYRSGFSVGYFDEGKS
jgi:cell division protein FtsQ